jgi:predicted CoA-binding protein
MSVHQDFWNQGSYAVVGNSARMKFPVLTYGGLKAKGKKLYAVDPSVQMIEGDTAYPSLDNLPLKVDAVVIEVPSDQTAEWVSQAASLGIKNVWIHAGSDTPEALEAGRKAGLNLVHGTCAVMYLMPDKLPHCIHKWIMKALGKY